MPTTSVRNGQTPQTPLISFVPGGQAQVIPSVVIAPTTGQREQVAPTRNGVGNGGGPGGGQGKGTFPEIALRA